MKEKLKVYSLACLLAAIGISIALYKHFALGLPLLPNQKTAVWTLEAKVEFETSGAPVLVSLALPDTQQGIEIGNEAAFLQEGGEGIVGVGGFVVVVVADVRPAHRTSDRFPAGVQTVTQDSRVPGRSVR